MHDFEFFLQEYTNCGYFQGHRQQKITKIHLYCLNELDDQFSQKILFSGWSIFIRHYFNRDIIRLKFRERLRIIVLDRSKQMKYSKYPISPLHYPDATRRLYEIYLQPL